MSTESIAQGIYSRLREAGLSHAGACGLTGNFEAESSLKADNLQNSLERKLGFVDELYTRAVDCGSYMNFANDGAGYGYAQWTYSTRKQKLLDFAMSRGASVGDGSMQVDFAIHELRTEYPELFSFLCSTDDLYEATARVCREYERPAVNNIDIRYEYAQKWDRAFGGVAEKQPEAACRAEEDAWYPPDLSILILQAVLLGNNYCTEITGYKNAQFFETLREFVTDIGG